jgi:hypothetical protein
VAQGEGPEFKPQYHKKKPKTLWGQSQWLVPLILATWEAKIGRIEFWGQPGQTVHDSSISKITRAKWIGGVTQAVECLLCKWEDPEFKLQYHKKKKKTTLDYAN